MERTPSLDSGGLVGLSRTGSQKFLHCPGSVAAKWFASGAQLQSKACALRRSGVRFVLGPLFDEGRFGLDHTQPSGKSVRRLDEGRLDASSCRKHAMDNHCCRLGEGRRDDLRDALPSSPAWRRLGRGLARYHYTHGDGKLDALFNPPQVWPPANTRSR